MNYSKVTSFILVFLVASFGQVQKEAIGTILTDAQAHGSHGQRIMLDDNGNAHVDWSDSDSNCVWNFRYADGSGWFGATPAGLGGHAQLATTRESNPDDQKTVVAYHYNAGAGGLSWIDIDGGQGWGTWPNDPKSIGVVDHIWPYIAVANNNNIVMATGDLNGDYHHLYVTTNQGNSWLFNASFDSCSNLTQFVRASHNSGSNKVVFVHTQFITDTIASGQLDQDVWYILSTDGGETWGQHTNLTNYQSSDSVRAYAGVSAVFDYNDDLHIVWEGRKVDADSFYVASKIFHWSEVTGTISVVNSPSWYYAEPGGWWIAIESSAQPGAWRLPADRPEPVVCSNGDLYCLWHGNDDYNDGSAGGYFNGELYGARSLNSGLTWCDYVNLTNTRSPGAGPGQCDDEDYMTAHPTVVDDTIFLTYIEDKDAGSWSHSEGIVTENTVYCGHFDKYWIPGIEESEADAPKVLRLEVLPNPFSKLINISFGNEHRAEGIELKIYDASGRLVKNFSLPSSYFLVPSSVIWHGRDDSGHRVPAGVYFIKLVAGEKSVTKKITKLR